ncbi:MAG TPA: hypothetical protein DEB06_01815 [Phycisphaerales bacterium]|nr:hypothetical protein [Phycisphaerales bacterium]
MEGESPDCRRLAAQPLTPEQLADAYSKGLGRALRHLRTAPDSSALLPQLRESYRDDPCFDGQIEGSRAWYIVECSAAGNDLDVLRSALRDAASSVLEHEGLSHALDLAAELGQRGDREMVW